MFQLKIKPMGHNYQKEGLRILLRICPIDVVNILDAICLAILIMSYLKIFPPPTMVAAQLNPCVK